MKILTAKLIITSIFFSCLLINLIICFLIKPTVWPENFNKLIILNFQVYSVHAAVLFTSFLKPVENEKLVPNSLFLLATGLSLIWNLLLTARLLMFLLSDQEKIAEVITFIQDVSSYSSFIIVGVLAYFFSDEKR